MATMMSVTRVQRVKFCVRIPLLPLFYFLNSLKLGLLTDENSTDEFPIAEGKIPETRSETDTHTHTPSANLSHPYVIKHLFSRLEPVSHVLPTTRLPCHSFSDQGTPVSTMASNATAAPAVRIPFRSLTNFPSNYPSRFIKNERDRNEDLLLRVYGKIFFDPRNEIRDIDAWNQFETHPVHSIE